MLLFWYFESLRAFELCFLNLASSCLVAQTFVVPQLGSLKPRELRVSSTASLLCPGPILEMFFRSERSIFRTFPDSCLCWSWNTEHAWVIRRARQRLLCISSLRPNHSKAPPHREGSEIARVPLVGLSVFGSTPMGYCMWMGPLAAAGYGGNTALGSFLVWQCSFCARHAWALHERCSSRSHVLFGARERIRRHRQCKMWCLKTSMWPGSMVALGLAPLSLGFMVSPLLSSWAA